MLNRQDALELLDWAEALNPGPWKAHSLNAARAAEAIAAACGMDAERAWVLGALHDIGRWEGVRAMHHIVAGYDLLMERGDPGAARICMTHSFPGGDPMFYSGKWDVTDAERAFVVDYISGTQMDDFDRLIQLCDALAMPQGICLIEKRLLDVALRHGVTEYSVEKWRAMLALCEEFSRRAGRSVYALFDDAVRVTFDL